MEGADSLCQKSRMPRLKSLGVTRGVELCDDSDAPQPGVLDDVRHVLLRVHGDLLVPGTLLAAFYNFIIELYSAKARYK